MNKTLMVLIVSLQLLVAPLNAQEAKRPCYKNGCKLLLHKMNVKENGKSETALVLCYVPSSEKTCAIDKMQVYGCRISESEDKNKDANYGTLTKLLTAEKKLPWAVYYNEHAETDVDTNSNIQEYKTEYEKWRNCKEIASLSDKSTAEFEKWIKEKNMDSLKNCGLTKKNLKYPGNVRPEYGYSWEYELVQFDDQSKGSATIDFEPEKNQNSKGKVNGVTAWIGDYCQQKNIPVNGKDNFFYFDKPDGFSDTFAFKTDFKKLDPPRWGKKLMLSV